MKFRYMPIVAFAAASCPNTIHYRGTSKLPAVQEQFQAPR